MLDKIDFDVDLAVKASVRTASLYTILKHHSSDGCILVSYSGISSAYGFITRRMWENGLEDLERLGLVEIITDRKERKEFISMRNSSKKDEGIMRCEWCNSLTDVIDEHHYPIPRAENGEEVVKICPNCHSAYHNGILLKLLEEDK